MAKSGPIPARSTALSRERDIERGDRGPVTKGDMQPVVIPEPDPAWHATAKMIYESYSRSGQSFWAQQSDWAQLWFTCSEISSYLTPAMIMEKDPVTRRLVPKRDELTGEIQYYPTHKLSSVMFDAINKALSELMFSEGARRRARIELEQPKSDDGGDELYLAELEEDLSTSF